MCRLFFVHASMSTTAWPGPPARLCGCVHVARCIIVSAGSWLGGPVDISGLRCSCLSGSRTQRARRLGLGVWRKNRFVYPLLFPSFNPAASFGRRSPVSFSPRSLLFLSFFPSAFFLSSSVPFFVPLSLFPLNFVVPLALFLFLVIPVSSSRAPSFPSFTLLLGNFSSLQRTTEAPRRRRRRFRIQLHRPLTRKPCTLCTYTVWWARARPPPAPPAGGTTGSHVQHARTHRHIVDHTRLPCTPMNQHPRSYSAHGCWISSGDQEIFGSPEEIYDGSLSWAFFGLVDRRVVEVLGHRAGNVFTEMCRNVCERVRSTLKSFRRRNFPPKVFNS